MSSLAQTPHAGQELLPGNLGDSFLPGEKKKKSQIPLGEEKSGAGIPLLGNAIYGLTMTLILNV